ncbi:hypothetical protein [Streptococcus pneumoniae]
MPAQGWKIHISSQIKDAVDILRLCINYPN